MKIELKKETNEKGETTYWTYIDNAYVSGSCSANLEDAEKIFEQIKITKGQKTIEILKSETI